MLHVIQYTASNVTFQENWNRKQRSKKKQQRKQRKVLIFRKVGNNYNKPVPAMPPVPRYRWPSVNSQNSVSFTVACNFIIRTSLTRRICNIRFVYKSISCQHPVVSYDLQAILFISNIRVFLIKVMLASYFDPQAGQFLHSSRYDARRL